MIPLKDLGVKLHHMPKYFSEFFFFFAFGNESMPHVPTAAKIFTCSHVTATHYFYAKLRLAS